MSFLLFFIFLLSSSFYRSTRVLITPVLYSLVLLDFASFDFLTFLSHTEYVRNESIIQ